MQLIDGKAISQQIKDEIKSEVEGFVSKGFRPPHLVAILVGDDGASQTYVSHKMKACEYVGFTSTNLVFPPTISQSELLDKIAEINRDENIDGLIVQLPLPKHINYMKVIESIVPGKDVDGFHPTNMGKMVMGLDTLLPATPYGVMELIRRSGIETKGKTVLMIGKSLIVGTPMSILLSRDGADATSILSHIHSKRDDLDKFLKMADIVIVAIGVPEYIKGGQLKPGAVVIDVGITRVADETAKAGYRLKGDVHFESASKVCSYITPVPGGVGPMTVTMLLQNTLKAYKSQVGL